MNRVKKLEQYGQAIWLDFIARGYIADGSLAALISEDALKGVTSNPAIFEKAIGSSDEYDAPIKTALASADLTAAELFERIAIEDIQHAADVLKPVYDRLKGKDGFVSLEVSPYLAHDAEGTIVEARRLWKEAKRKNLMVKVPATKEGLIAIKTLIGEGISINITLLFAQQTYRDVVEAYLSGLEHYVAGGGDPAGIASVASFFVSRIDTVVDKQLDELIAKADAAARPDLTALKGKVAIANAKLAYQDYLKLFAGPRWEALRAKGAQAQRLLWASTGTKNKDYRDTLYVEELIGDNTVNTVPPATLDAFRDHGETRTSLTENVAAAQATIDALSRTGISLDKITTDLVADGVKQFADAADKLYGAVAAKRAASLGKALDTAEITVPDIIGKAIDARRETWRASAAIRRLWKKDASVWTGTDEAQWLGWLTSVNAAQGEITAYTRLQTWVKQRGFTDAVVLGMGGSSLGPEVIALTFARQSGFPRLHVLDSTDPAQVRAMEKHVDLAKTLFIVSSKSGGTTEPNVLKAYFYQQVGAAIGKDKAGEHFIAVTDPGSSLGKIAATDKFAHVFEGDPSIGGRYSVLSPFGLVPAAVAGVDVEKFLAITQTMVKSCGPDVPPVANPGVQLGLVLGEAGLAGRDKVTLFASPGIGDFGAWAEQLIAESTGKDGKGLIPIADEPIGAPDVYGNDRVFIDLRLAGESTPGQDDKLAALAKAGHPVVSISVQSPLHIGQEFFRFELATAVAGAIIGINPFNQPDVEASKIKTRDLTAGYEKSGALPSEQPIASFPEADIYTDAANADALRKAGAGKDLASWIRAQLSRAGAGDYVAILAFLDRTPAAIDILKKMRTAVRDARHVATCAEFGPRFLHSTGQAYKGGPNSGVFVQITSDAQHDLAVPGQKASFGTIKAAQARGDFDVLTERKRRALRIHLKGDGQTGLGNLEKLFTDSLK